MTQGSTGRERSSRLGRLHRQQRGWHPGVRVLWWAFLLPVAVLAWAGGLRFAVARVGGYALAVVVALFGLGVVAGPAPAAPAATPTPTSLVAAPAAAPVAPTAPVIDPVPAQAAPAAPAASSDATPAASAATPAAASVRPLHRAATAPPRAVERPRPARKAPSSYATPARPRVTAPAAPRRDTYTNVDGNRIQRPTAAASRPAGATAKCQDGTWSFSQHRQGTCSGHGGVSSWL